MDLGGFLGRHASLVTRLARVVVIQQEGVHAGLLVDEVLGMRHFFDEEQAVVPADLGEELRPFVSGAFARDGSTWLLFSMHALATHPQFLKVAS
jgi:twitching motility protein PilI